jgi:hypothetical protein
MGALFGVSNTNASTPKYTGMQLQSSAYGIPVPVVYGVTRVGCNLLDYVNFLSHQTPSSSGGKGGIVGGGGKGSSSTSYSASVAALVCEGPATGINSVWSSQTHLAGTPGFDVFDGTIAQTPWAYLTSAYPTHALTYSGFVYAGGENYDLGSSANLPNLNWEPLAIFAGSAPGTYGGNGCYAGGDADFSKIVPDILSNGQYGVGFPAARVGQVNSNDEAHAVPGGGPYTITVTNAATYSYNINATVLSGIGLLTCVASSPATGQYSFNAGTGVYTFNAAQAGVTVNIRYVSVGLMVAYQNFTLASGLWASPAFVDQTAASSIIDDIATASYSEVVWSSGVLQMIPRGTVAITANGYTFTPNTTPLFNLTVDDFMPNTGNSTDDPITLTRVRKSDQTNVIRIEALDRANQYAPMIVEASDMGLIQIYGRRVAATKSLHMFADVNAATVSAHLQLQDEYILNHYSFQLDERYGLLDPMDMVGVTDVYFSGLTGTGVRLLDLSENDDGTVVITAEEYPGTLGSVPAYNIDIGSGAVPDFNVDPGNARTPAVFDVPVQGVGTFGLETWLATCSATGNPNWGGCEIHLATASGGPYAKVGEIVGGSRIGVLTATLASGSDPDTTHTASVDLSLSLGVLESGTTSDADTDTTLCFIDGEYVAFSTATLTSTYNYDLTTYLRRGQWGSAIASHAIGGLVVRLDDNVFTMPYVAADKGRTIYIKLRSFNIYKAGYQDVSSLGYTAHTIGGPPAIYAPTSLAAAPTLLGIQLKWVNAPNVGIAAIEIWRSPSSSFGSATRIADAGAYDTAYTDQSVAAATTYWYWIRPRDIAGNEGNYDPSSGGAGATATSGIVSAGMLELVDPDNLILDAQCLDPTYWSNLGVSGTFTSIAGAGAWNSINRIASPVSATSISVIANLAPFQVRPSERYYMECAFGMDNNTAAGVQVRMDFYDEAQTYLSSQYPTGGTQTVAALYHCNNTDVNGFEAPAGSFQARILLISFIQAGNSGNFYLGGPVVRHINSSSLIGPAAVGTTQLGVNNLENIITNPQFVDGNGAPSLSGWVNGAGTFSVSDQGSGYGAGGWPCRYVGIQQSRDIYFAVAGSNGSAGATAGMIPVTPGDVWFMSATAANGSTHLGQMGMHFLLADGTADTFAAAATIAGGVVTPTFISGQVTVPAGYIWAQPWMQENASSGFGNFAYTNVICRKATDNPLLAPNAAGTTNIILNAVTANPSSSLGAVNVPGDQSSTPNIVSVSFTLDFDCAVTITISGSTSCVSYPTNTPISLGYDIKIDGVTVSNTGLGALFDSTTPTQFTSNPFPLTERILVKRLSAGAHTLTCPATGINQSGNSGYPYYAPVYSATPIVVTATATIEYPHR